MNETFARICEQARSKPEVFWAAEASNLDWTRKWDRVLSPDGFPVARWFEGGLINACFNCVDRHVIAGHGGQPALIYESPVTNTSRVLTFAQLRDSVSRLAGALRAHGVRQGDTLLIYMPNSPEAVIAMLACARIGAVHSVVFGGFAPRELAARIDDAQPKLVLTASCGIEAGRILPYQPIIETAFAIADHERVPTIVWQRSQHLADLAVESWFDWALEIARAEPVDCVPVAATDPLYILYTSGTTGKPKGIVRDTGGHLVTLLWSMQAIYDCSPGQVFWAASDVGWVVGHSYICYAPLLNRNPSVIFEGKPVGTPDAGVFWRIMAKHKVRSFFTAPTAIRAIKQQDPLGALMQGSDLSALRAIFFAGERTDPSTLSWVQHMLDVPVIDHWWQTETGSPICAIPLGLERIPAKAGSAGVAMPGWQLSCLDETGAALPPGESGAIVAKLPLPPGFTPMIWRAPDRFCEAYLDRFPGYYLTGDAGYIDTGGYVFVMSRIDDVINVAGHRLSSSAMEEVLAAHPDVAECAVVAKIDDLKGHVPVGFVVIKAGVLHDMEVLQAELIASMRSAIGPVAAFKEVYVLPRLPKTRSGKILRKTIREIVDKQQPSIPTTIEDPAALEHLLALFRPEA